jgi:hypothetical protein
MTGSSWDQRQHTVSTTWRKAWNIAAWMWRLDAGKPLTALFQDAVRALEDFAQVSTISVATRADGDEAWLFQTVDAAVKLIAGRDDVVAIDATLDFQLETESGLILVAEGGRLGFHGLQSTPGMSLSFDADPHDPDSETEKNQQAGWGNFYRHRAALARLTSLAGRPPEVDETHTSTDVLPDGFSPDHPDITPGFDGLELTDTLYSVTDRALLRGRLGRHSVLVTAGGPADLHPTDVWDRLTDIPAEGLLPLWRVGSLADGRFAIAELEPGPERAIGCQVRWPELIGAISAAMAGAHDIDQTLIGVRPEVVYTWPHGGFAGMTPRWRTLFELTRPFSSAAQLLPFDGVWDAPEVLQGGPVTPSSDVWLLGALIHYWTSGHFPFDGAHELARVGAVMAGTTRPYQGPESAREFVAAALRPDPADRPGLDDLAV